MAYVQSFKPSDLNYKHQKISKASEIQNLLFEISQDKMNDVKEACAPFLNNIVSAQQFFQTLKNVVTYRPFSINYCCELLTLFTNELKILLNLQLQRKICIMFKNNYRILLTLVEIGVVDIENIIDNYLFPVETDLNIKKYFFPEIAQIKPAYFQTLYDVGDMFMFLTMNMNNTEEFQEKRRKGINEHLICQIIINDEIDKFVDYVSHSSIDLNSTIPFSMFEASSFVSSFSNDGMHYIDYSAFYGSVKIFKYLISNHVKIQFKTMNAAVVGGNYEIIHLLEEFDYSFTNNCLFDAVISHRNEIANYILDNSTLSYDSFLHADIIPSYNLEFIIDTTESNDDKFDLDFSLFVACENNFPDVVEFLLSFPKYVNINFQHAEFYNMTVLHKAALSHFIEVIKVLLHYEGINSELLDSKIL